MPDNLNQPDSEIGPTNWRRLTKLFGGGGLTNNGELNLHAFSFLANIEIIFFCDIQSGSESVTILWITRIIRRKLKKLPLNRLSHRKVSTRKTACNSRRYL